MSDRSPTVLVTGATGMVGAALIEALAADYRFRPLAAYRSLGSGASDGSSVAVGEIGPETDWSAALAGCDAVVHCAARAHVLRDGPDARLEYQRVNVDGTLALAQQAARVGVKHFIFISSAGVHGSANDTSADETEPLSPVEPYALSKLAAERQLKAMADRTPLALTILRPPLIYGPRAKGNMARLTKLVLSGLPLPIASVHNRRSLVGVSNLCNAILTCLADERSRGRTYLVTDQADISTAQLVRDIASAAEKRATLFPLSPRVLELGARLAGREKLYRRLVGNLTFDSTAISRDLGWRPILPRYDLKRMVEWMTVEHPAGHT